MKIVNIILTSQNGGAEQVFIDYMVILKKIGHQVLAIVKHDAPYADKISSLGIEVRKIKNSFGYHDFLAVKNISEIIQNFDADITISHMGRAMTLVRKAVKKNSNKKIFQICVNHSMNVKRSIGADMIFSVNRKIFYRTIDRGQSETKSFVIPNSIEIDGDARIVAEIALQKKEKIVFGVMGRVDRGKGFQHAVGMIKNLETVPNHNFALKIAGSGHYESHLKALTAKLGVESKVEFSGWVQNKKDFFSAVDIFLMTSEEETFGLVLLEAMKYGKPIISTNTDGAKEILRNGIDAIVLEINPLRTIDQRLAQAALTMIGNDVAANQMVENSSNRLREKFTYRALERVMREILPNNQVA